MSKLYSILIFLLSITSLHYAQSLNFTIDWSHNTANFEVGSTQQITWESEGIENVRIEYTTDAGKTWKIIEESYPAENGSYDWVIPNDPSIYCRIRISDNLNNNFFKLQPNESFYFYSKFIVKYYFTIYGENKWGKVTSPTNQSLKHIKFTDDKNGFAWGKRVLIATTNGGEDWFIKSEFVSDGASFISQDTGWIFINNYQESDSSALLYTANGGNSWVKNKTWYYSNRPVSDQLGKITGISFIDKNNGWLSASYSDQYESFSQIYKIKESGNVWNGLLDSETTHDIGYVKKLEFINKNFGYLESVSAVDFYKSRLIGFTYDGGLNWKFNQLPNEIIKNTAWFNNSFGWASTLASPYQDIEGFDRYHFNNSLYKRDFSLEGWQKIYEATNKGPELFYSTDSNKVWFFGQQFPDSPNYEPKHYFICMSLDAGETWELQQFDLSENFKNINSFFSLNNETCWAVGDGGAILRYYYPKKNIVSYKFTLALPQDTTIYTLTSGNLLEGGNYFFKPVTLPETYTKLQKQINLFEGTRFSLDEDAIYEDITLDIRFMGMDNDGSIINPVNNTPLFMFLGIEVTGEQSGVTNFEDYYRFNEGKKARICIPRTKRFLELLDSLGIGDDKISFAFLKGGEYFEEGLEWEIKEGKEGEVDSLCLYMDHFSQIVGGKNIITEVEKQESQLPTEFSLSQNYPNPFNPTTTIKYTLPAGRQGIPVGTKHALFLHTQLKVYDILGREVTTLVNKQQNPGYYEVLFDANNLTSGIYYYQLKAGGFVETKKMLMLK